MGEEITVQEKVSVRWHMNWCWMDGMMLKLGYVFLLATLASVSPAPTDGPVKVDLPVINPPEPQTGLDPEVGETRDTSPYPSGGQAPDVSGHEGGLNDLLAHKVRVISNVANAKAAAAKSVAYSIPQTKKIGLFASPEVKLEAAEFQPEGFESKPLTKKENVQQIVAGVFQPKPILDTITEEEKYGNTGDKFAAVGRAVVGGAAGISNFVNTVLQIPSQIFNKITRTASEKLNNFGGKLIGLQ